MSDLSPVLPESFGVPIVWIFTPDGDILRDYDEVPISKYLYDFEYKYDEENDDLCIMKFRFEDIRSFDLPYFQQDVILCVQWGYILAYGNDILKSPMRKIAIRDLQSDYKSDCIELELQCTDLISYLKGYKSKTIRRYENVGATSGEQKAVYGSEDNFIKWLGEIANGQFNVTVTKGKNALRIDKFGEQKSASYNVKTGNYSSAVDNVRVRRDFVSGFRVEKTIKGKSMALTNAIEQQLKLLNDQETGTNGGGGGGPFIQDSTDDTLEIKQRNFNQNIYKAYTYAGGSGELLSFMSNTNTRKERKDITSTSGINPYTKKVETTIVATADTKNKGAVPSTSSYKKPYSEDIKNDEDMRKFLSNSKNVNNKPNKETLNQYYKDARDIYKHNFENPLKQKELPSLRYSYTKYNNKTPYMGRGNTENVVVNIPAQTVLNMPEFQSLSKEATSKIKSQFRRESILTGYTVEKIQRKYEADMKVIGDPSLIKGKVIYINNLGRLDKGKWYIVSCSHKITMGEGYVCDMNLMRNPSTVGLNLKRSATNPVFDRKSNDLTFKHEFDETNLEIYDEVDDEVKNSSDMDSNTVNIYREEGKVGMSKRLDDLKAEEDFKLNKEEPPIPKEQYQELYKPNNDKN